MRLRSVFTLMLLVLGPHPVRAQGHDDSLGIRHAALDYIAGWYSADGDRMAQAVHAELAKRIYEFRQSGQCLDPQHGRHRARPGYASGGRLEDAACRTADRGPHSRHLPKRRECAGRCRRVDRLPPSRSLARTLGHSQCALGAPAACWRASPMIRRAAWTLALFVATRRSAGTVAGTRPMP